MSVPPFRLVINRYQIKTAADRQGTCFICSKLTDAVMVGEPAQLEWFFVCRTHTKDGGFCKPIEPVKVEPPKKEIEKGKQDEKKKEKKDDEKKDEKKGENKEDKKDDEKKEEKKDDEKKEDKTLDKKVDKVEKKEPEPQAPMGPIFYNLNKDIFYLRQKYHDDKANQKRTASVLKNLPSVPK